VSKCAREPGADEGNDPLPSFDAFAQFRALPRALIGSEAQADLLNSVIDRYKRRPRPGSSSSGAAALIGTFVCARSSSVIRTLHARELKFVQLDVR
jgi:hypothetical protein